MEPLESQWIRRGLKIFALLLSINSCVHIPPGIAATAVTPGGIFCSSCERLMRGTGWLTNLDGGAGKGHQHPIRQRQVAI